MYGASTPSSRCVELRNMLLNDRDSTQRIFAAGHLARLARDTGYEPAVQALIEAYSKERDNSVRQAIVGHFEDTYHEAAFNGLEMAALRDVSPGVRASAVGGIPKLATRLVIDRRQPRHHLNRADALLRQCLRDPDPQVRQFAEYHWRNFQGFLR